MSNSDNDELASWKEIAAYLGISVRTAQMWETERNLPVRRLPGGRGRVLASVAELEKWKSAAGNQAPSAAEETNPPAPTEEAPLSRVRFSRAQIVIASVAFSTAILVAILLLTPHRSPFSARVERDVLVVLDQRGAELWTLPFPKPLLESANPEMAAASLWVGDLDDDGRPEVLFSPHTVATATESLPLICYDERGGIRWTYRNDRSVRTADESFSNIYGTTGYQVVRLGPGRPNAVLLSTEHQIYFPGQIALLSSGGRILREYWHSGHLSHVRAADRNGDGKPEFYAAGINNARHAATLIVLDEDHFRGAAREPDSPHHQLLDFEQGIEVRRLLLPQTCLSKQLDPYNTVATMSIDKDELVVQTSERIGAGAGVFHHFSMDLLQHHADLSDSYRIEHRRAVLAHTLNEVACPVEPLPDAEFVAPLD